MGNEKSGSPWDKRGIYLRLSKRRKARLLSIAKELGHEDSPHRALAAYIEDEDGTFRASANDPLLGLEDKIDEAIGPRLDALARSVATLERKVAESIEGLGEALAPLASLNEEAETLPLAHWLARAEAAAGMKTRQGALVLAKWLSTKAFEDGMITLEFKAQLARIDDRTDIGAAGGLARIEGIAPAGPLALAFHASAEVGLYLACKPMDSGAWAATAFQSNSDGTIGLQSASFQF